MSEDRIKWSRKCKSESRAPKKQTATKKRRIQRKATLKKKNSKPSSDKPSTSAASPLKFSIQVEVESCDEDWWYEEDIDTKREQEDYKIQDDEEQEKNLAEEPLKVQNTSDVKDQHDKRKKLKFAYLEALNKHGVIEKLEESSCSQIHQSGTQMESLLKIKQEPPEDLNWIKREIDDENSENEDDTATCENLTEHLGITIKEEPLTATMYEDQDLIGTNNLLLKVGSEKSINLRNSNELPVGGGNQEQNIKEELNLTQIIPRLLESPDSSLTIWDVTSRYFGSALQKAVHPSYVMIDYFCGLCGQAEYGSDLAAFRCHLNEAHLSDALVFNSDSSGKDAVTIRAESVSTTDSRYVVSIRAAYKDLHRERSYLERIMKSVFRGKINRVCQIISYKCYICQLCYEHLSHFIRHLTTKHSGDDWEVYTEVIRSGFVSVIVFKTLGTFKEFPVISDDTDIPSYRCLKCKMDFFDDKVAFFKHCNEVMKCFGCKRKLSCHGLHIHIGQCQKFFDLYYPKTCPCKMVFDNEAAMDKHQKTCSFGDTTLAFNCLVCNFVATTLDILLGHQRHTHTVRSDQFVFDNALFSEAGQSKRPKKYKENKQRKRKLLKVETEKTTILTDGFCSICNFRRPGEDLLQHLENNHLVRSDVEVKPLANCKWCDGSFSSSELMEINFNKDIVPHDESCILRRICRICYKLFTDLNALELHLRTKHVVSSLDAIYKISQKMTKCCYCLSMYPGPFVSHHCPQKLDTVQCFYCHQQFQNNLFLNCHLNGHPSIECTNCKKTLQRSCMKERHRLTCEGVNMMLHECLKCGFKEEDMWAIDTHCMECFSEDERAVRVFFSRELIIKKADTVSTDPSDDHMYTKRVNPTRAAGLDGDCNETRNAVNGIICNEVYEEIDKQFDMEKEKSGAFVPIGGPDDAGGEKVAHDYDQEGTSDIGSLEKESKEFVSFKVFDQNSQIKSEPMDEEAEFVVTKVMDMKTELSIEEFIENNFEIGIEPEVLVTINPAAKKTLNLPKCRHCPFEGNYSEFKLHLVSCDNLDEKIPLYNASLPPECLLNCTFRCHVCCVEYATLQKYYKHDCARSTDCPCCGKDFQSFHFFKRHLVAVVGRQYVERAKYPLCMQCTKRVRKSEVFNHWLEHSVSVKKELQTESAAAASRDHSGPNSDTFRHLHKPLSGELLGVLLHTLTRQMKHRETGNMCIVCEKRSYRKREYKIHLIEHLLKDALVNKQAFGTLRCQLCSEEYENPSDYKLHMRQHARMPTYKCPHCDKKFSDSSNLAKHRKVHNVAVKICDLCGKKFSCKIMLAKHLTLHQTAIPIQCAHCPESFLFNSELKRHNKNRHRVGPVNYRCSVCNMMLNSMKLKWEHEWEIHRLRKISADCPLCGEQFRRSSDVKQHLNLIHNIRKGMQTGSHLVTLLATIAKAKAPRRKPCASSKPRSKSGATTSLNDEEGISWEIRSTDSSRGSSSK